MIPLADAFLRIPLTHRGYHNAAMGRIENSQSAFAAAMAAGYGIELDLQPSADGQAMVFHDATLDRLTNETGNTCDRTAAELGQITLMGGPDTIPTLAEVLATINENTPLLIELKPQGLDSDGTLERATADALVGYAGPVAVMSFDPNMVARLASLLPDTPRGLVTGSFGPDWNEPRHIRDYLRPIPDYDTVKASFISHEVHDLDAPRVAELKSLGAAILTWTVTSQNLEIKARKIADNITFEGYAAALP